MVAINFPAGAVATDRYTDAGKTWEFDGSAWNLIVTTIQIPNNSIDTLQIVDSAVTTGKIADGTIVNADINATAGITKTKISGTAITAADTGTVTSTILSAGTATNGYVLKANTGVGSGMAWSANTLDDITGVALNQVYSIGDTGPAGGKIFITPSTAGNSTGRYFEASPFASPDLQRTWATNVNSNRTTLVSGADGTAIGTGEQNTIDIVAQAGNVAASSAAAYCSDYTYGGFSDWFLPSKNELNELYVQRNNIGGFTASGYWASSEIQLNTAWCQNFFNGGQSELFKDSELNVRAVRSFAPAASASSGDFLKYDGTNWVNDPINLGTDTTGNYMSNVSAGAGITISHTPAEGSTATVSVVAEDDSTIIASRVFG